MDHKQDMDIKNKEKGTYTKYYEEIRKNLKDTDYLTKRGISLKVQKRFKIGFDPEWVHPKSDYTKPQPMVIIPTGTDNSSYFARSTNDHFKCKAGNDLFNPDGLKSDKNTPDPVFITESEIDALSILECGLGRGFKAVGLGSTVNKRKLISKLKDMLNNKQHIHPLILYLNNNSFGQESSKNLAEELKKLKIPCVNFHELIKEHKEEYKEDEKFKEELKYLETLLKTKDPNDALNNNRDKFERALLYAYTTAKFEHNKYHENFFEDAKTETTKMKPNDKKEELLKYIESSMNKPALATGFDELNEILNGGFKGGCLYGIGAVPSLGKTTLILQIADYIAEHNKRNICIFSLEMSENDLMLKSVVRETYSRSSMLEETKSVSEIFKIKSIDEYNELTENKQFKEGLNHYFKNIKPYIHIDQGIGDIGIAEINKKLEDFTKTNPDDKLPMIIVDYVQILAPYKNKETAAIKYITDKQSLDKNILELKRIARNRDIPVIVILSFNRDSYANEVNFKSFKESGVIEYSTDVIIGLQLKIDKTPPSGKTKLTEEDIFDQVNKAKNKKPREVELVVLKNRFGKPYKKIPFNYYPQYDFFKEEAE